MSVSTLFSAKKKENLDISHLSGLSAKPFDTIESRNTFQKYHLDRSSANGGWADSSSSIPVSPGLEKPKIQVIQKSFPRKKGSMPASLPRPKKNMQKVAL